MAVTIRLYTDMGPFNRGSVLIVSTSYARQLITRYGSDLRIESTYPGTYWFQDGAVLSVYPAQNGGGPYPPPTSGSINVIFKKRVTDPTSGVVYNPGVTYQFTLPRLQALVATVNNLVFSTRDGRPIEYNELSRYVGRTIYADTVIYAFRQQMN